MKLSFKMTGEDFYLAWKERNKKSNMFDNKKYYCIILIALIAAVAMIFLKSYYSAAIIVIFTALFAILTAVLNKKRVISSYEKSVVTRGVQTIKLYDEGLEILNSYEKVFVPWNKIYFVKDTPTHLIILPMLRKGILAVNKSAYACDELNEIIGRLTEKTGVQSK